MDTAVLEQARWWSWRRQRLDRSSSGTEDALRSVCGVSGVNPWGALALLARVPRLTRGTLEGIIETRRAVRVPAMRGAVFLLPADTAYLAFAATGPARPDPRAIARGLRLTAAEYTRLRREIPAAAGAPRTSAQIRDLVEGAPARIGTLLEALCAEGVLLPVKPQSIRSDEFLYASTAAWLGEDLKPIDPGEALVWLAGDYLHAFGPAAAEDFAWWAGLARDAAAEALAAHDPVDLGGGLLLHRSDARAFEHTRPHLGRVNLLPRLDPYLMGYIARSRERFATAALAPALYESARGASRNVVLVEGRAEGFWSMSGTDRLTVKLRMLERPAARLRADLEGEAALAGTLLDARETVVRWEEMPPVGRRTRAKPKPKPRARAKPKPKPRPKPRPKPKPRPRARAKPKRR